MPTVGTVSVEKLLSAASKQLIMNKVKEPNEPERQIHSIMKRYVKNLMFNSCFLFECFG